MLPPSTTTVSPSNEGEHKGEGVKRKKKNNTERVRLEK